MNKCEVRRWICSATVATAMLAAASGVALADRVSASSPSSAGPSSGPSAVSQTATDTSSAVGSDLGGSPAVESATRGVTGLTGGGGGFFQSDQNNARSAVERGDVRPYGWLLKRIKKAVPGDIVKVRLKRNGQNAWTYDVTVLSESGRFVQVSLNAKTGAILSQKNR